MKTGRVFAAAPGHPPAVFPGSPVGLSLSRRGEGYPRRLHGEAVVLRREQL